MGKAFFELTGEILRRLKLEQTKGQLDGVEFDVNPNGNAFGEVDDDISIKLDGQDAHLRIQSGEGYCGLNRDVYHDNGTFKGVLGLSDFPAFQLDAFVADTVRRLQERAAELRGDAPAPKP